MLCLNLCQLPSVIKCMSCRGWSLPTCLPHQPRAAVTDVMEGKPKELVGVINILFHDDQPGHMLFQGPGYHHWISEDFGKTYVAIETPGKTLGYGSQLKLHPTQPDWVLARVRRNECLKVR